MRSVCDFLTASCHGWRTDYLGLSSRPFNFSLAFARSAGGDEAGGVGEDGGCGADSPGLARASRRAWLTAGCWVGGGAVSDGCAAGRVRRSRTLLAAAAGSASP